MHAGPQGPRGTQGAVGAKGPQESRAGRAGRAGVELPVPDAVPMGSSSGTETTMYWPCTNRPDGSDHNPIIAGQSTFAQLNGRPWRLKSGAAVKARHHSKGIGDEQSSKTQRREAGAGIMPKGRSLVARGFRAKKALTALEVAAKKEKRAGTAAKKGKGHSNESTATTVTLAEALAKRQTPRLKRSTTPPGRPHRPWPATWPPVRSCTSAFALRAPPRATTCTPTPPKRARPAACRRDSVAKARPSANVIGGRGRREPPRGPGRAPGR